MNDIQYVWTKTLTPRGIKYILVALKGGAQNDRQKCE